MQICFQKERKIEWDIVVIHESSSRQKSRDTLWYSKTP